jgi:hypothetical protein
MGVVVMRCPRTGREVPTGTEIERDEFQNLKPVIHRMRCPACGSEHVWSRGTAQWRSGLPGTARSGDKLPERPKDILDGLVLVETAEVPERKPEPAGSRRISALVNKLLGSD